MVKSGALCPALLGALFSAAFAVEIKMKPLS